MDLSRATWAGPMLGFYELPQSDSLLGGAIGAPTFVTGMDPSGYAQATAQSWLGPNVAAAPASSPSSAPSWWPGFLPKLPDFKGLAVTGLVGLLAVALVILGVWYIVKD